MSALLICSLCCFAPNSVIQAEDSIQNSRLQPVPITIKSPSTLMATFAYVNTDIDGNGTVDVGDLLVIISALGARQ